MGDDDGIVVPGRDSRHRLLPVFGREMFLPGDEQPRLRVKLQKLRSPLVHQVIGNDEHGLFGQIKAAQFHCGGRHGPGLPGSHDVSQKRASTLKNPPNCILLMRRKIAVAERSAHHSRQGEMRAIEISKPDIVEAKIVVVGQALSPAGIFPDPLPETIFQLLLLFARGDCLGLIYGAVSFRVLIIGCRRPSVQRLFNQVGCTKAGRTVGRGVAYGVLGGIVQLQRPGCDGLRIADFHGCRRYVQQLGNKSRMSERGIHDEPRRASISPGSRSGGCTACNASTFRW